MSATLTPGRGAAAAYRDCQFPNDCECAWRGHPHPDEQACVVPRLNALAHQMGFLAPYPLMAVLRTIERHMVQMERSGDSVFSTPAGPPVAQAMADLCLILVEQIRAQQGWPEIIILPQAETPAEGCALPMFCDLLDIALARPVPVRLAGRS